MVQDFKAILPQHFNIVSKLNEIKANTLIISGTKDKVAELKFQHIMKENISNSDLVLLEDAHMMLLHPCVIYTIVDSIKGRFIK